MGKNIYEIIDSNYILLQNTTNQERAKKVLESYLLDDKSNGNKKDYNLETVFEEVSKYDIAAYIAKQSLIYSCQKDLDEEDMTFVEFRNSLIKSKVDYDGVVDYLYENRKLFKKLINSFVKRKYESKEYKKRKDVLKNNQYKIDKKKYSLGDDLHAIIDRGDETLSQEDAVLLLNHPDNEKFKLIAVADGDSSRIYSEEASNYALKSLLKWFEGLDSKYYNDIETLKELLINKLNRINYDLSKDIYGKATTIAVALVGKSNTLISTVGDSKIYLINGDKIIYETKDDSYIQMLCDKGIADPEKAKFYKASNILNYELGIVRDNTVIPNNTKIVPNDYQELLILSDGVVRMLSNITIEKVASTFVSDKAIDHLVDLAKRERIRMNGIDVFCDSEIEGNSNNMTAAIYAKRAGMEAVVFESDSYGGQIINTPEIENYPGIKNVSGFEFATSLYEQAASNLLLPSAI